MMKEAVKNRRPEWLKVKLAGGNVYKEVRQLIETDNLHTVCQSARCPNIGECWARRTATFMILGDVCTRNCRFCAVQSGQPSAIDGLEPQRVAKAVEKLGLRHAVITSVTRDDLGDGGAAHFVKTIKEIRRLKPGCTVEVLIPDFCGNVKALSHTFQVSPEILNHNLEVIPRLYPAARPQADFMQSLSLLEQAKGAGLFTKTGIMVGLGENRDELIDLFEQLVAIKLDILTIGQYLQPRSDLLQVEKFYHPDEFKELKVTGEKMGIAHVESGPLVRSSYHADRHIDKFANS